jgi:branched-chain amino acid transport system substrate-binding protein
MRFSSPFRRVVAALAAALLVAVVPLASSAADPYEIYSIQPMTGPLALIGKNIQEGLQAFEESFNRAGGLAGRPIKFVIYDDQTNPQIALQLVNSLAPKNLPFILGPGSSGSCNAVFPLAKNGPVIWCYSNQVSAQPGTFEFQALVTTHDLNSGAIRWMRNKGWTRLAMLTPTDSTGMAYDRSVDEILQLPENRSMTLVAREKFNVTDVTVAAQVAKIKAARPQVIFLGTAGTAAGTALHGISDAGLELPVITGTGNASVVFMKQHAAYLPKEIYVEGFPCLAPSAMTSKAQKSAYQNYVAAIEGRSVAVDCLQTVAWDAGMIFTAALRRLGTNATAEQVRAYLANLTNFTAINGTYDFRRVPQRGIDDRVMVMIRWDPARSTWIPASKIGGAPL